MIAIGLTRKIGVDRAASSLHLGQSLALDCALPPILDANHPHKLGRAIWPVKRVARPKLLQQVSRSTSGPVGVFYLTRVWDDVPSFTLARHGIGDVQQGQQFGASGQRRAFVIVRHAVF